MKYIFIILKYNKTEQRKTHIISSCFRCAWTDAGDSSRNCFVMFAAYLVHIIYHISTVWTYRDMFGFSKFAWICVTVNLLQFGY